MSRLLFTLVALAASTAAWPTPLNDTERAITMVRSPENSFRLCARPLHVHLAFLKISASPFLSTPEVPRDHVRGSDHTTMAAAMNAALATTPSSRGVSLRRCDHFEDSELVDLLAVLHAARDPSLEATYAAARDPRRLQALGAPEHEFAALAAQWRAETAAIAAAADDDDDEADRLFDLARDARCHGASRGGLAY